MISNNLDPSTATRRGKPGMIYVGTMFYQLKDGTSCEDRVFNEDMSKVVKCMVKYAEFLSLRGCRVSGSMVEELDKFWEFYSNLEGGEDERSV